MTDRLQNSGPEPGNEQLELFRRVQRFARKPAILASLGPHFYADLLRQSARVARDLLVAATDLEETRVAFLVPPGYEYVTVQWGVWRAGGVAVPLCRSYPPAELAYHIRDADAKLVIGDTESARTLRAIANEDGRRFLALDDLLGARDRIGADAGIALPFLENTRRAMILYTSGTTSRPKGVVSTHANIEAQIEMLVEAWGWSENDRILNVLPLHHVHGIVNVLLCAMWSGATCEFMPRFEARAVWERFVDRSLSLFMAVPTIYVKLIAAWDAADAATRQRWSESCDSLRLMVSGSAALPVQVLERWREISGHVLLERYGMTEIGMALSNPLSGERRAGFVGLPLPGVEVALLDESGSTVEGGAQGEIHVRGPAVFHEYWRQPETTRDSFRDGWFRTGDIARIENGMYKILGRMSVDIIKTGGYKVSALEVEEVLLVHDAIRECAVVGVKDDEWGERVACAIVLNDEYTMALESLREWGRDRLAPYKLPSLLRCLPELPRNALGKVTKPTIIDLFT
jgi:malonyl-CoA/methylmalonyl-CoA synthetase